MMTKNKNDFTNKAGVLAAIKRALKNLIPPPDILPSEWAERNVRIPVGNAIAGAISFKNAPYQRGMLDAIKRPNVRRVTYMTGAQLGKTTVQQCITGYFIHHDPRSQILIMPTEGDMQTFQETKLRPMIDANPSIAAKMAKARGRDGVNNGRIVSFMGGFLMFSWAGAPRTLRSRSAPIIQADEIDGYAVTKEGSPLELAAQRSATFGDLAIRTESSTPTFTGASKIETSFEAGTQERFYVPCPDCEHPQYLRWEQVRWEGRLSLGVDDYELDQEDLDSHDPDTAMYCCEACGSLWSDAQRVRAIREAEERGHGWKASRPYRGHVSFHAPELLSTFRKLRDIVQSYLDKITDDDMQSFMNVSLALTYEEKGEKADPANLMSRREQYAAQVPMDGVYLTAGIDMQMDRLEVEVVAWGIGEESWSIDYSVLWGDPLGDEVWNDLDDYLSQKFEHESGAELMIQSSCLDTGGTSGYTQRAYEYARGKTGRKLFAIKGVAGWGRPIIEKPMRKKSGKNSRKVDLFLVGVDEAKLVHMRRLNNTKKGAGYCHFPLDRDADWFKQITAEKLVIKYIKGQPVREWHKDNKARNEGTDCRAYAIAALKVMNPPLKRIHERLTAGKKTAETVEVKEDMSRPREEEAAEKAERIRKALAAFQAKVQQEKPQEVKAAEPAQNDNIKRSKRTLSSGKKRKGWATNY
jgi:phage terminase large subunit GpA-like protein